MRAAGSSPVAWLEEHGDAMFAYAVRRLGRSDQAEDAVQEALLAALGSASGSGFRGESTERTWLIGILRHKVLDVLRSRKREPGAAIADDGIFAEGSFAERQTDWDLEPGAGLESDELRRVLLEAIDTLPELMRQAVCLREIDGVGTDTVAELLGVSRDHVWTLVHRAKARLRNAVAERQSGADR